MNNFEIINALKQIHFANRNKKLALTWFSLAVFGLAGAAVFYFKHLKASKKLIIYQNKYLGTLKENIKLKHDDTLKVESDKVSDSSNNFTKDKQI